MKKVGRSARPGGDVAQQQVQLSLQPQLQLLLQLQWQPQLFPELPQQQQIRMTMMMSHRQEPSLLPLLKHMIVTSL